MSGRDKSGKRFKAAYKSVEEDVEQTIGGETVSRIGGVSAQPCAGMSRKHFTGHIFGGKH